MDAEGSVTWRFFRQTPLLPRADVSGLTMRSRLVALRVPLARVAPAPPVAVQAVQYNCISFAGQHPEVASSPLASGLPSSATHPVQELVIAMTEQVFAGHLMVRPDKRNWKYCCWCFVSVSAGCGVRSARPDRSYTELAVIVRRIAKITAVSRPRAAVFIIFNQRLIHQSRRSRPVNGGTDENAPVFSEAAKTVTHRGALFASDRGRIFRAAKSHFLMDHFGTAEGLSSSTRAYTSAK